MASFAPGVLFPQLSPGKLFSGGPLQLGGSPLESGGRPHHCAAAELAFQFFLQKKKRVTFLCKCSRCRGCCMPKAHIGFEPSRIKCLLAHLSGVQPLSPPAFRTCGTTGTWQEPHLASTQLALESSQLQASSRACPHSPGAPVPDIRGGFEAPGSNPQNPIGISP